MSIPTIKYDSREHLQSENYESEGEVWVLDLFVDFYDLGLGEGLVGVSALYREEWGAEFDAVVAVVDEAG